MGGKPSKSPDRPSRSPSRGKQQDSNSKMVDLDTGNKHKVSSDDGHVHALDEPGASGSEQQQAAELNEEIARALEAISNENEAANMTSEGGLTTSAEVLVNIPHADVHLIQEEEESVPLASGNFSITRILQRGRVVAVFAKLGDEFQWPLARDAPTLKLDDTHYVFTLRVPISLEEAEDMEHQGEQHGEATTANVLNYGVAFHGTTNKGLLKELDKTLESYSAFVPIPTVKGNGVAKEEEEEVGLEDSKSYVTPATLPATVRPSVTKGKKPQGDQYWDRLAPNVDKYNSPIARAIAAGSGELVKGILWVSEMVALRIEESGLFMQKRIKPKKTPAKVGPETMKNIQRAKKVSKMSENLASSILSGVVTATGSITSSVMKSKAGAKFFSMLPGEAALATMDAFVRVFDALEMASKNVMSRTSLVTCQVVSHRFGDEAAALAKEGLSTAGHMITTAWTISKIRTAITPKGASANALLPTTLKTAATAALEQLKKLK